MFTFSTSCVSDNKRPSAQDGQFIGIHTNAVTVVYACVSPLTKAHTHQLVFLAG